MSVTTPSGSIRSVVEHAGSLNTEIGAGVLLKDFKANAQLGCLLGQCLALLSVVIHGENRER